MATYGLNGLPPNPDRACPSVGPYNPQNKAVINANKTGYFIVILVVLNVRWKVSVREIR